MVRLELGSAKNLGQNETSLRKGGVFCNPGARIDQAKVKLARESTVGNFLRLHPDMQIIIGQRFIQNWKDPPTHQELGEQEFPRGPRNKLTREAVQQKERFAFEKLMRLQSRKSVVKEPVERPRREILSDLIVFFYEGGLNASEIDERLKCGLGVVYRRLRKREIKRRPPGPIPQAKKRSPLLIRSSFDSTIG